MPTSKDFTYTRVLFTLFRNVMNYRNLRLMHVSVIYRSWNALVHYTHTIYYARVCSKTMHSLLCITSKKLPYTALCYIASRFILCLGTFAHGFIMLPPGSLASSRRREAAIIEIDQQGSWGSDCIYVWTSINFAVRNGFTCRLFLKWNAPRS